MSMRNNDNFTRIFRTKFSHFVVILSFKRIHDNKRYLFFRVTLLHFYLFQIQKNKFFKMLYSFRLIGPVVFRVGIESERCRGNWKFGRHLFVLAEYISCIGKNSPVALIEKIAVIWRLPSTPFRGTFLAPLKLNVYFPGDTYERGVWSRLMRRSAGMSWLKSTAKIALWKVSFS